MFLQQTKIVRLLFSDAEFVDSSVKLHQRMLINDANASQPIQSRESVLPDFQDAGHKRMERKAALRRERADRHAIERGENEGLIIRSG